jgi:hypothetical protein
METMQSNNGMCKKYYNERIKLNGNSHANVKVVKCLIFGLNTKTYWLTDRQSRCDFDFDFDLTQQMNHFIASDVVVG